jgi:hypothetical protein
MARPGPNRRAVDATIHDLRAAGRLSGEHSATLQLARSLASAVDASPENAALVREYRGALNDLLDLAVDRTDEFVSLVERLRAPVGDTAN